MAGLLAFEQLAGTGPEELAEGGGCCKPAEWPQHMPVVQRGKGKESFSPRHSQTYLCVVNGWASEPLPKTSKQLSQAATAEVTSDPPSPAHTGDGERSKGPSALFLPKTEEQMMQRSLSACAKQQQGARAVRRQQESGLWGSIMMPSLGLDTEWPKGYSVPYDFTSDVRMR